MARSWIERKDFNEAVKPGDDFFNYVNGGWVAANPIPPEESRWGSFILLRVEVEKQLKAILDDLVRADAPAPEKGSIRQKVRDFYLTAMDVEKANQLGIAPLAPLFDEIDAAQDARGLSRAVAHLHRSGIPALWFPYVDQDEKNTEVIALHPYQGGLGLPDRDYYLNEDEKSAEIRAKYLAYMKAVFGMIGIDEAFVAKVVDVETQLAKASDTRVEMRDPERQYNKMSFGELATFAPAFSWQGYFDAVSRPAPAYVVVGQPKFIEAMSRLLQATPLDTMKIYLKWRAVNNMAPLLGEALEKLRFDFYSRTFSGAAEMKARWRRVLGIMNSTIEDAVAQLYVEKHFSAAAKKKVNELVDHLMAAYHARIERLDWMGPETKAKAIQKLGAIARKLGYPDQWKDLAPLSIGTDSYAGNYMAAQAFEFDRQMKKVGGPVDRTEWRMLPQVVNACYDATMNEITFPAAILQPPFFGDDADDALNFGGIGSVIGHELTHGFDDQGSQFDARGNLERWWTAEDRQRFEEKTARLVAQYDAAEILPGLHGNGKLTLGENIADLGGLLIAYDGLQQFLAEHPEKNEIIDGFTPAQRFFIGYAITERGHEREAYMRLSVQTDPHSRSKDRVNIPPSNMEEFYEAFDVKPGNARYRAPEERVKIW